MSHDRYESADFSPGTYIGTLEASRVVRSVRTENVGITACWTVTDVFGRACQVWRTLWLSAAALPYAKRELQQFGIHTLEDLDCENPLPIGTRCRLTIKVVMDRDAYEEIRVVKALCCTTRSANELQ